MVAIFAIAEILFALVCVPLCLATDGDAWWFAVLCVVLYLCAAFQIRAIVKERGKNNEQEESN